MTNLGSNDKDQETDWAIPEQECCDLLAKSWLSSSCDNELRPAWTMDIRVGRFSQNISAWVGFGAVWHADHEYHN